MSTKQTSNTYWARVKQKGEQDCWEWQGACNSTGYGNVSWHGKVYTAHRVAAWLSGMVDTPSAPEDLLANTFVLHKCDNRKCCNPRHFFIGSQADNLNDAYTKQRKKQPRGQHHANAKLTNKQVMTIRSNYAKGQTQTNLAEKYGVSQRVISLIVRMESYK